MVDIFTNQKKAVFGTLKVLQGKYCTYLGGRGARRARTNSLPVSDGFEHLLKCDLEYRSPQIGAALAPSLSDWLE